MPEGRCAYLVLHDSAVCLNEGLGIEGGFPKQHLVETDTEGPPVALSSVHTSTILHRLCGGYGTVRVLRGG